MDDIKAKCEALGTLTGLQVCHLDDEGNVKCGADESEYCRLFRQFLPSGESCNRLHALAASRARDIGEAYIFACHAGVCHVVRSLDSGAVLAGPFLLGELDAAMLGEVANKYPIKANALLEMYEVAAKMKELTTSEAGALIHMMDFLFGQEQVRENEKLKRGRQQRRISESIHMYKGFQSAIPAYPYDKERVLVEQVRAGDSKKADEILNELLGYALFSTGGDLEGIKSWTAELCALLSRASMECGVNSEDALRLNRSFMRSLWEAGTIDELCHFMQQAVERFCESVFPSARTGERAAVARAIRYIHLSFHEPIALCDAAREAHLSESYFSSMFKRVTGVSFRAYLNGVRCEEAKRLLGQDDLSITEIALGVGFDSQSYFSKVFKSETGVTPKMYRKKLHVQPNE